MNEANGSTPMTPPSEGDQLLSKAAEDIKEIYKRYSANRLNKNSRGSEERMAILQRLMGSGVGYNQLRGLPSISDTILRRARRLYKETHPGTEITPKPSGGRTYPGYAKLSEQDNDDIKLFYSWGYNGKDIARSYNCSSSWVYLLGKRAGISRHRTPSRKSMPLSKAGREALLGRLRSADVKEETGVKAIAKRHTRRHKTPEKVIVTTDTQPFIPMPVEMTSDSLMAKLSKEMAGKIVREMQELRAVEKQRANIWKRIWQAIWSA